MKKPNRKTKALAKLDQAADRLVAKLADKSKTPNRCCASKTEEHMPDCPTRQAKEAFDMQRARNEAVGMEVCMVVVGYVSGKEPFRLLGRVSADMGEDAMPDPPLTMAEMQPVALAAKMALAKVLASRRRAKRG